MASSGYPSYQRVESALKRGQDLEQLAMYEQAESALERGVEIEQLVLSEQVEDALKRGQELEQLATTLEARLANAEDANSANALVVEKTLERNRELEELVQALESRLDLVSTSDENAIESKGSNFEQLEKALRRNAELEEQVNLMESRLDLVCDVGDNEEMEKALRRNRELEEVVKSMEKRLDAVDECGHYVELQQHPIGLETRLGKVEDMKLDFAGATNLSDIPQLGGFAADLQGRMARPEEVTKSGLQVEDNAASMQAQMVELEQFATVKANELTERLAPLEQVAIEKNRELAERADYFEQQAKELSECVFALEQASPNVDLFGLWRYSTFGTSLTYRIVREGSNAVFLQDALRGVLSRIGEQLQTTLNDISDGTLVGYMQFKILSTGILSSNFKEKNDTQWGPEIVATKVSDENSESPRSRGLSPQKAQAAGGNPRKEVETGLERRSSQEYETRAKFLEVDAQKMLGQLEQLPGKSQSNAPIAVRDLQPEPPRKSVPNLPELPKDSMSPAPDPFQRLLQRRLEVTRLGAEALEAQEKALESIRQSWVLRALGQNNPCAAAIA
jgi:hypothetical protein